MAAIDARQQQHFASFSSFEEKMVNTFTQIVQTQLARGTSQDEPSETVPSSSTSRISLSSVRVPVLPKLSAINSMKRVWELYTVGFSNCPPIRYTAHWN